MAACERVTDSFSPAVPRGLRTFCPRFGSSFLADNWAASRGAGASPHTPESGRSPRAAPGRRRIPRRVAGRPVQRGGRSAEWGPAAEAIRPPSRAMKWFCAAVGPAPRRPSERYRRGGEPTTVARRGRRAHGPRPPYPGSPGPLHSPVARANGCPAGAWEYCHGYNPWRTTGNSVTADSQSPTGCQAEPTMRWPAVTPTQSRSLSRAAAPLASTPPVARQWRGQRHHGGRRVADCGS